MTTTIDLSAIWRFPLRRGNSDDPRNGACLLDAVSWLEYGTLGDHPPCVCPVYAAFGRGINDALSDAGRQRLRVFIPRLVGTVDPSAERARAEYLAWQAVRVFTPIALDAVGRHEGAERLRSFEGTLDAAADAAARAAADAAAYAAEAAACAARAAAYAADAAAEAAAYAACAALAACAACAALAACAACAADGAARAAVEDAMIAALDGVLMIGRQASDPDVVAYSTAVERFAKESGTRILEAEHVR